MSASNLKIRSEQEVDFPAIHIVHQSAFGTDAEALLVKKLRKEAGYLPELSLVVSEGDKILGHILFTPINIISSKKTHRNSLALAPMAVLPEEQNKGIGTLLIRSGLEKARHLRYDSVIVLGHPQYYVRFGFVPARHYNIRSPFPAPDEAFMAIELKDHALRDQDGDVVYLSPFYEMK